MIIYKDPEKERTLSDYIPVSVSLKNETLSSLQELYDNLCIVQENAYIYHADLLEMAITGDIRKVNLYIRMKEKQAKKA